MFKIEDGREHFYQWDIDRRIIIDNPAIGEVHFSNIFSSEALVVNTYQENGITLANVPNILLQKDWPIDVYTCNAGCTNYKAKFEVESRNKPADYVYTETEVLDFEALEERMEKVEENMKSFDSEVIDKRFEDIQAEINNIELTPGEKGEPGEPGKDGYTPVKGTDYWTAADKQEMVNEVLAALPTYEGEVEQL